MERRRAYWKIHGEPSADPRKAEKKAEKQKKNNPKPKEVKKEWVATWVRNHRKSLKVRLVRGAIGSILTLP